MVGFKRFRKTWGKRPSQELRSSSPLAAEAPPPKLQAADDTHMSTTLAHASSALKPSAAERLRRSFLRNWRRFEAKVSFLSSPVVSPQRSPSPPLPPASSPAGLRSRRSSDAAKKPASVSDDEWLVAALTQPAKNADWLGRAAAVLMPSSQLAGSTPAGALPLQRAWANKIARQNTFCADKPTADVYRENAEHLDFDVVNVLAAAANGRWRWEAHSVRMGWIYIEARIPHDFRCLLEPLADAGDKRTGRGDTLRRARNTVNLLCLQAWNLCPRSSSASVLMSAFVNVALEWISVTGRPFAANLRDECRRVAQAHKTSEKVLAVIGGRIQTQFTVTEPGGNRLGRTASLAISHARYALGVPVSAAAAVAELATRFRVTIMINIDKEYRPLDACDEEIWRAAYVLARGMVTTMAAETELRWPLPIVVTPQELEAGGASSEAVRRRGARSLRRAFEKWQLVRTSFERYAKSRSQRVFLSRDGIRLYICGYVLNEAVIATGSDRAKAAQRLRDMLADPDLARLSDFAVQRLWRARELLQQSKVVPQLARADLPLALQAHQAGLAGAQKTFAKLPGCPTPGLICEHGAHFCCPRDERTLDYLQAASAQASQANPHPHNRLPVPCTSLDTSRCCTDRAKTDTAALLVADAQGLKTRIMAWREAQQGRGVAMDTEDVIRYQDYVVEGPCLPLTVSATQVVEALNGATDTDDPWFMAASTVSLRRAKCQQMDEPHPLFDTTRAFPDDVQDHWDRKGAMYQLRPSIDKVLHTWPSTSAPHRRGNLGILSMQANMEKYVHLPSTWVLQRLAIQVNLDCKAATGLSEQQRHQLYAVMAHIKRELMRPDRLALTRRVIAGEGTVAERRADLATVTFARSPLPIVHEPHRASQEPSVESRAAHADVAALADVAESAGSAEAEDDVADDEADTVYEDPDAGLAAGPVPGDTSDESDTASAGSDSEDPDLDIQEVQPGVWVDRAQGHSMARAVMDQEGCSADRFDYAPDGTPITFFGPSTWDQTRVLCQKAAQREEDCEEQGGKSRRNPPGPPHPEDGTMSHLAKYAREGRSAYTTFLRFVRELARQRARRQHNDPRGWTDEATGIFLSQDELPGLVDRANPHHPLAISLGAHKFVHGPELWDGWSTSRPTTVAQFCEDVVNVHVELWSVNRHRRSWRNLALGIVSHRGWTLNVLRDVLRTMGASATSSEVLINALARGWAEPRLPRHLHYNALNPAEGAIVRRRLFGRVEPADVPPRPALAAIELERPFDIEQLHALFAASLRITVPESDLNEIDYERLRKKAALKQKQAQGLPTQRKKRGAQGKAK